MQGQRCWNIARAYSCYALSLMISECIISCTIDPLLSELMNSVAIAHSSVEH